MAPYSQKERDTKVRNWEIFKLRGAYQNVRYMLQPEDEIFFKAMIDRSLKKLGARTINEQRTFHGL